LYRGAGLPLLPWLPGYRCDVAQPDEAVAGDGFRAVAPDMRGIGDSYARLASRHEHEDLARLLRENTPRSDDQKALWEHDPIGLQRADLRGSR
jgi:hypothetical protein